MISNKINLNNKWKGFKDFFVYKIVKEDEVVILFYLKLLDGSKFFEFVVG